MYTDKIFPLCVFMNKLEMHVRHIFHVHLQMFMTLNSSNMWHIELFFFPINHRAALPRCLCTSDPGSGRVRQEMKNCVKAFPRLLLPPEDFFCVCVCVCVCVFGKFYGCRQISQGCQRDARFKRWLYLTQWWNQFIHKHRDFKYFIRLLLLNEAFKICSRPWVLSSAWCSNWRATSLPPHQITGAWDVMSETGLSRADSSYLSISTCLSAP